MSDDIEPLDALMWFDRIRMIAEGKLGCVENSLRHARHLLQLRPRALQQQVDLAVDDETFEALLEAGQFDTAAMHLVLGPAALTIDPGSDGHGTVTATITCSVLGRAISGTGPTTAEAVLDAWTSCLLSLRTSFQGQATEAHSVRSRKGPFRASPW